MINEALESLTTAVEEGRSDVIQDIVNTVKKCEENDEGIGLTLSNLFRSECGDAGTILHLAVERKDRDSVRTLLSLGAFPSCKNEDGYTAFEISTDDKLKAVFNEQLLHNIAQGNIGRVQEFLDAGCSVECIDSVRTQNRALHWAASYGTLDIIRYLIEQEGAEINPVNSEGLTPLHDAVQRNDPYIIQILVHYGADPNIRVKSGKLAGKNCFDIVKDECRKWLVKPENDLVLPKFTKEPPTPPVQHHQGPLPEVPNFPAPIRSAGQELSNHVKSNSSSHPQPQNDKVDGVYESLDQLKIKSSQATKDRLKLLWPQPRRVKISSDGGVFKANDRIVIASVNGPKSDRVHDILDCWRAKRQSFQDLHIEFIMETIPYSTTPAVIAFDLPSIICHVDKTLFRTSQSYKLTVMQNQVRICSSDLAGLHYAISTFIQLLEIFDHEEEVPCLQIQDWPMMLCRGVMLDCSKGRILHEANLWELIDRLSILKINEIHLYSRFNTANVKEDGQKSPDIWQFPYSRSLLLELDRFCYQRFVNLVPVLDVIPTVTSEQLPTLFPIFSDFLSCFSYSRKINVGPRLSLMLLDINEAGIPSTLNFLPLSDKHQLLLCSEALKQIDMKETIMWLPANMVLLTYGYNPEHDFSQHATLFSEYGCSFCVCPGTSSWNSLGGIPQAAVRNIYNAIIQGLEHRTMGMVCCDWSGKGHVTDTLCSMAPLVAAAGLSWNAHTKVEGTLSVLHELMDVHMLADQQRVTGRIIMELGQIELDLIRASLNKTSDDWTKLIKDSGSLLFQLLYSPDEVDLTHLNSQHFQKAIKTVRSALAQIKSSDLQCYHGEELIKSLRLTLELIFTACRLGQCLVSAGKNPSSSNQSAVQCVNVGVSNISATSKTDVANRLLALRETYKTCWVARHLPNGYKDSQAFLFKVIPQLLPNSPEGLVVVSQ